MQFRFFEVVKIEKFVGYRTCVSLRTREALILRYRFSSSYENSVDEDFRLLSAMIFYSLRNFVRKNDASSCRSTGTRYFWIFCVTYDFYQLWGTLYLTWKSNSFYQMV